MGAALLTEPERVLFRRLAVFMGGFDLHAAQAIAGYEELHRHQILDLLTLLGTMPDVRDTLRRVTKAASHQDLLLHLNLSSASLPPPT